MARRRAQRRTDANSVAVTRSIAVVYLLTKCAGGGPRRIRAPSPAPSLFCALLCPSDRPAEGAARRAAADVIACAVAPVCRLSLRYCPGLRVTAALSRRFTGYRFAGAPVYRLSLPLCAGAPLIERYSAGLPPVRRFAGGGGAAILRRRTGCCSVYRALLR